MSTKTNLDPESLAEQLHSTAIHLLRNLRKADELSGTTGPRLSALSVVVFNGPITLGDLAKAEQVRPPTMTRIVHALEEQGFVTKAKNENDGRVIHISATVKGKRLLIEGRARRVHVLAEEIGKIEKDEQVNLLSSLATIKKLIVRMRN